MREVRTSRYRLALVGAGRRRQGTGPFLANYLKRLGQPPCAVIGGDPDRAQAAAENLARQFNIQASAHSSLRQLGAQEKVDALVIASPTPTHLHYLNEGIRQSCHVFCEKPLWWPATMEAPGADRLKRITQNLLTGFARNGKTLHLNQQWPFTLETFWRLYPSLSKKPQAIQEFSMKLSPRSQGQTMVLDAAPHLLSMLYALLGEGSIERLSCKKSGDHQCRLSFAYHHQSAQTAVRLKLNRHISQPRPAAYAINGHWVKRCVKLDNYSLSLDNGEQTMPMPDPLKKSLERFLSALRKNSGLNSGEARLLLKGMQDLHQLVSLMDKNSGGEGEAKGGRPPGTQKVFAIKPLGTAEGKPVVIKVDKPAHTLRQKKRRHHSAVKLSALHDFAAKLSQPSVINRLRDYVRWQVQWRAAYRRGLSIEKALESAPRQAPISINLDLTTNCNYRCDHCVDIDILNTSHRHVHERLKQSLSHLIERGLKSVILIGGGEPTIYPGFEDIVRHLKAADIQLGVVTNGSLMRKIAAIAEILQKKDWVRLSLDSADNETFRLMHKPGNKKCTLDWICEHIPAIKKINSGFQIGYSFIIVWRNCQNKDVNIIENVDEIYAAAERARRYRFDYISYKPFLVRAETNNAEIIEFEEIEKKTAEVVSRIEREIARAKKLENENFHIVESTNLRVLADNSYRYYGEQPRNCHMQFFRQVLSPLGLFNCPVYRHVDQATVGNKDAYCSADYCDETTRNTLRLIEKFDASEECQSVTCLYNDANWHIERLINHPEKLDELMTSAEKEDYFL